MLARYLLDRQQVAAGVIVDIHHLSQTAALGVDQHVRQEQRERLAADKFTGTPHRVPKPKGALLAGEAGLAGARKIGLEKAQFGGFAPVAQGLLEFELFVEVVFDYALVAPSDEYEVLDAGLACFVDHDLDQWTVDNCQHFLGHGLCGRQEAGAQSGHGKNGLFDRFFH